MKRYPLTKKMMRQLRNVATGLPNMKYTYLGLIAVTGADLIARGVTVDNNKKPVLERDPITQEVMVYHQKHPYQHDVNHYRRMKRGYQQHGPEFVIGYVSQFKVQSHAAAK